MGGPRGRPRPPTVPEWDGGVADVTPEDEASTLNRVRELGGELGVLWREAGAVEPVPVVGVDEVEVASRS